MSHSNFARRLSKVFLLFIILVSASIVSEARVVGPPSILKPLSATTQTTTIRSAFPEPLKILVTDALDVPVPATPIQFIAPSSGPSLTSTQVEIWTDGDGVASLTATANNVVGSYTVIATIDGGTFVTFNLSNVASLATIVATAGTPQSTEAGTVFKTKLEATAKDEFGNPVSGAAIVFGSVRTSNARPIFPEGNTAITGTDGKARVLVQANAAAGSFTVSATSGNATPASFQLTNTPKQTLTLYAPALSSGTANEWGIAWTNPLDKAITLTLTARSYNGLMITGPGIQNPAQVTIATHGQIARQATDIFGAGIANRAGWVEVTLSDAGGGGFFLMFNSQLSSLDGGPFLNRPASRIYFPQVNKDTTFQVVNVTDTAAVPVSVTMYDNGGNVIGSTALTIDSRSGWTGHITDLLPAAAGAEGHAVFETAGGLFSAGPSVLVGLASYQTGGDSAVVLSQDQSSTATTLYAVHVPFGGGYSSRLKLINWSSIPQQVQLTFNGQKVTRTIPVRGRLDESIDQLFSVAPNATVMDSLKLEMTSNIPGIAGFVEISGSGGRLLTAEYLSEEAEIQHVFSHVAQGSGYLTQLVLYNPEASAASATIELLSSSGATLVSKTVTIGPNQRVVGALSDLLSAGIFLQFGGFVRVTSTNAIYTFELLSGPEQGANFIANIPVSIY